MSDYTWAILATARWCPHRENGWCNAWGRSLWFEPQASFRQCSYEYCPLRIDRALCDTCDRKGVGDEQMHDKSDIAAELACRDMRITKLEMVAEAANKLMKCLEDNGVVHDSIENGFYDSSTRCITGETCNGGMGAPHDDDCVYIKMIQAMADLE